MGHHGAPCPKRTSMWSSDPAVIQRLVGGPILLIATIRPPLDSPPPLKDHGVLEKAKREPLTELVTTRGGLSHVTSILGSVYFISSYLGRYQDSNGNQRFQGSSQLKASGSGSQPSHVWNQCVIDSVQHLMKYIKHVIPLCCC